MMIALYVAIAWLLILTAVLVLHHRGHRVHHEADRCRWGHAKLPGQDCWTCDEEQLAAIRQQSMDQHPSQAGRASSPELDALANDLFQATANRNSPLNVAKRNIDAELQAMVEDHQPREHAVPCHDCQAPTWNVNAHCDRHQPNHEGS